MSGRTKNPPTTKAGWLSIVSKAVVLFALTSGLSPTYAARPTSAGVRQAMRHPAPLSAKALAATPITLFSLFSTWRR